MHERAEHRAAGVALPVLDARPRPADDLDSDSVRQALAEALSRRVRGEVRFGRHDRLLYATDASIYQVPPIGVVVPRDIADAEAVVRFCAEHGLPLLPRGGGTALAGQTVNHAVVIDFSQHCRDILELDAERRVARVAPGVVLDQLNAAAAPAGLMFGPDVATSSHATLGGMIGNNSAGAWSILYGRTSEHLRAVDVLMADGERLRFDEGAAAREGRVAELTRRVAEVVMELADEIRARYPRIQRHVDGYNLDLILDQLERSTPGTYDRVNLAHLICGSEGTLATVVEAELALVPRPKARGLAIVGYASVDEALATLQAILATGPAAVELVDDVVISMALANVEYRRYVEIMPRPASGPLGAVLYVEYFADDVAAIPDRFEQLRRALPECAMACHADAASMAAAWKLRKAGEPLLHGVPGVRKPITFVEDTAVDPRRLPEFVAEFRAIVARHGTTAAYYAHASVGCLHIRPLICLRDEADLRTMEAIATEVAELVARFQGALSGEHGDGRVRSPFLERYFGKALCDGFRRVKEIFDPEHRMNPGNIVAPAPMASFLRVRPDRDFVTVPEVPTFFRYEREHGFDHAVEMCNGAGICRRLTPGGTLCPSYRALLDERHATRGRGNALRLALTGQLADDGRPSWSDPEVMETLRLCLSCKACKTECPSNVDISKLKAEYLAHHYAERGGPPLAARAFGHVRRLNRLGSALHPIANTLNGTAFARWAAGKVLGFDARRSVPRFERSLHRWFAEREGRRGAGTGANAVDADAPVVVLMPDCFTVYNEPRVGAAAIRALEHLGFRVLLPGEGGTGILSGAGRIAGAGAVGCCGRSLISVGMLTEAGRQVAQTAAGLLAAMKRVDAVALVGCEPSCVSAIKDDWLELELGPGGPAPAELRALAAKTFMVEEFVDASWGRLEAGGAMVDAGAAGDVGGTGSAHAAAGSTAGSAAVSAVGGREATSVASANAAAAAAAGSTGSPARARVQSGPGGAATTEVSVEGRSRRPDGVRVRQGVGDVILHAHCHQKALWGAETSARALRRIAGERVKVLDSGCCGMAGSFGYTRDRYELSMAIGELSVFPPVRAAAPDAVICAPGTSCRHQIHDGAGRRAVHPIELIADALGA